MILKKKMNNQLKEDQMPKWFIAFCIFMPPIISGFCLGYMQGVKEFGNPYHNDIYMYAFVCGLVSILITGLWASTLIFGLLEIKMIKEEEKDIDRTESGTTNTP